MTDKLLRAGELARRTGVSTDTLRLTNAADCSDQTAPRTDIAYILSGRRSGSYWCAALFLWASDSMNCYRY
jgi:hypothetical protein